MEQNRNIFRFGLGISVILGILIFNLQSSLWAQVGITGQVRVVVADQSGAVLPGANLELVASSTKDTRVARSQTGGTYTFVNLPNGTYQLIVTDSGFKKSVHNAVLVEVNRTTNVEVRLSVGSANQSVVVSANEIPLLDSSSNMLTTTVDMKQLQNLPLFGRNLLAMAFLVPGYQSAGGREDSTYNGAPGGALGYSIDGISTVFNRYKSAGTSFDAPLVQARLESIGQMTINTGSLDASTGGGQAATRVQFVTRRGTNQWHGSLFEEMRNAALNANTYLYNAVGIKRPPFVLNDFGGTLGGPILKNRLFFFFSLGHSIQPSNTVSTANILGADAAQGIYRYQDTNGTIHSINIFNLLPANENPVLNADIASAIKGMNDARQYSKVSGGDLNVDQITWNNHATRSTYFPSYRVDYNPTDKLRFASTFSYTKSDNNNIYGPPLPGPDYAKKASGSLGHDWALGGSFNWIISPNLLNSLQVGKLSNTSTFSPQFANANLTKAVDVSCGSFDNVQCGISQGLSQGSFDGVYNFIDNLHYQKGNHSLSMGVSIIRDNEIYHGTPGGIPNVSFGMVSGDPLTNPLSSALANTTFPAGVNGIGDVLNLYALLTGRISSVNSNVAYNPSTKSYQDFFANSPHEIMTSEGMYAQDSWQFKPNLTFNYGLRWDIVGAFVGQTGLESSPTPADLWGPSGVDNLFKPGKLPGIQNPQIEQNSRPYTRSWVNPEPHVGVAWMPRAQKGLLGKLFGKGKSVIRASYSLLNYTEGDQTFNENATGPSSSQSRSLNASSSATGPGFFTPGSLTLGNTIPDSAYLGNPASFAFPLTMANYTWSGGGNINTIDPHIKQPYMQTYTFGIQRELSSTTAFDVRYVGTHSVHQWMSYDINQVNIKENGFLTDFKTAQANLQVCQSNPTACENAQLNTGDFSNDPNSGLPPPTSNSFADWGLAGQGAMPLLDSAFGATGTIPALLVADATDGYQNGGFVQDLQTGQAWALASDLAATPAYFCRMVGSAFSPCLTQGFDSGGVVGQYPINVFQVNPYAQGHGLRLLDSVGYSNYNALQVELKQHERFGLELDANYTYSKSLGNSPQKSIGADSGYIDLHNESLNYAPTAFDIRHSFNFSSTYDLPFGPNRRFLTSDFLGKYLIGGWTLGSIIQYQTGAPFELQSGVNTTTQADSGVVLNGITRQQLQSDVGIFKPKGKPYVYFINPKLLAPNGALDPKYVSAPTTPGQFGQFVYLYGPRIFSADFALTKHIPITERVNFTLQGEFLNAFNHVRWLPLNRFSNSLNIDQTNFGQTNVTVGDGSQFGTSGDPRNVQIRASLSF